MSTRESDGAAQMKKSAAAAEALVDMEQMRRNADAAARLLKSLAHGQRLRVLCLLVNGELSVGQINEHIALSQSALSQHLARLRDEGLVATRRDAQTIFYRLNSGPVEHLLASLHEIYCDAGRTRQKAKPRGT